MAFATASSPANRKPGATRKPQHHPKRKRDRVNRQGTPNPLRAPEPQRAPGPTSARQAPERARTPSACRNPRRVAGPQRARAPARAGTKTWWVRCRPCSGEPSPQRTPGRKPGSGASAEPTIGLRDANRATRRVPRALAGPSSESPRQRIVILSGLGQNKRFFAASKPKHAIICAIGKPTRAQPTKTSVSRFRYREKPSVLTASDQNRRFFASRALHDSPFPCPTSSTPVIDLGDGRLLRQA